MISEEFRRKFTEELGIKHYTSKVQKILEAKEIYTSKGTVASARTINNVFGGHQDNEDIELAINDVYEEELLKKKKLEALRVKHSKKPYKPKQITLEQSIQEIQSNS